MSYKAWASGGARNACTCCGSGKVSARVLWRPWRSGGSEVWLPGVLPFLNWVGSRDGLGSWFRASYPWGWAGACGGFRRWRTSPISYSVCDGVGKISQYYLLGGDEGIVSTISHLVDWKTQIRRRRR